MVENLKQKAAKGILWKFLDQGGTQLIQFISGIYIARILSPDDYGLVGMMAIFLGISQVFIDSGFKATLIQKGNDITNDDYNVVFYFNLTISIFFYSLIFMGAPKMADFFNEPRLTVVARVLGFNLVLISLGMIHQIIFEKKINFKTLTKINLISIFVSVCSGIGLALVGYGVWALVAMVLVENFVRSLLLWIINKWVPDLSFRLSVFKKLFATGSKLLFAGILQQISMNIFSLVIGRFFTTTDVGFYSQARKLQQRIGDFITYSIQGVLLPVQSLMKDDIPRLKNAVRTNVKVTTLISFPAIIGLMAIAKPFVTIALTEKWLPSVDYIYILSVAGFFFVLSQSIHSYILPIGKINFIVGFTAFSNFLLVALITIGLILKVDLKLLIVGKAIQELIVFLFTVYYAKQFIRYQIFEIIKDIMPATSFSIIMGIVVYFLGVIYGTSILVLGTQIGCGIIIYLFFNMLLNRKLFLEIIFQLKKIV